MTSPIKVPQATAGVACRLRLNRKCGYRIPLQDRECISWWFGQQQTPMAVMNEVQQAVWATNPGVALAYPDALEHAISKGLYAGPRFALLLMIIFGCVGLILVTVGVYSVLAYTTAQKTHEIGIRMALGAERANVLRLVILAGLRLVADRSCGWTSR